jgi:hypothetical protein
MNGACTYLKGVFRLRPLYRACHVQRYLSLADSHFSLAILAFHLLLSILLLREFARFRDKP